MEVGGRGLVWLIFVLEIRFGHIQYLAHSFVHDVDLSGPLFVHRTVYGMEYDQRFTPGGISDAGYKVAFGVIPGICFGYLATILIFVWRTVELQERSEQL